MGVVAKENIPASARNKTWIVQPDCNIMVPYDILMHINILIIQLT
jgi:hypothetical protein